MLYKWEAEEEVVVSCAQRCLFMPPELCVVCEGSEDDFVGNLGRFKSARKWIHCGSRIISIFG